MFDLQYQYSSSKGILSCFKLGGPILVCLSLWVNDYEFMAYDDMFHELGYI